MVKEVFAVYDHKAAVFCLPFYLQNRQMAIRAFVGTMMDKSSEVGKFPEDYELFYFGSFDDESGRFDCGLPVSVGRGSAFGVGSDARQLKLDLVAKEAS